MGFRRSNGTHLAAFASLKDRFPPPTALSWPTTQHGPRLTRAARQPGSFTWNRQVAGGLRSTWNLPGVRTKRPASARSLAGVLRSWTLGWPAQTVEVRWSVFVPRATDSSKIHPPRPSGGHGPLRGGGDSAVCSALGDVLVRIALGHFATGGYDPRPTWPNSKPASR